MFNIEKSKFKRGVYVGYSDMIVWNITKSNGSSGSWLAMPAQGHGYSSQILATPIYAHTLKEMSTKLREWRVPA